jgi:hypothetical protein
MFCESKTKCPTRKEKPLPTLCQQLLLLTLPTPNLIKLPMTMSFFLCDLDGAHGSEGWIHGIYTL